MSEAPKRVWVWEEIFEGKRTWTENNDEATVVESGAWGGNDYVRADIADDMLEALKTMVELARPYMRDDAQMIGLIEARAAIAKAKGTTE